MPYYCTVPRCTSMAGKAKNVSFHQFPRDEELAKLWNEILKRGKPYTKYSKVCSLHFRPEDYTITSVGKNKGQWRTLRKDAIPSQNLPSDSAPYQRRQSGAWVSNNPSTPPNLLDPVMQQQMAQAIYMQTMLAMQAAGVTDATSLTSQSMDEHEEGQHNSTSSTPSPHTSQSEEKPDSPEPSDRTFQCQECSKCFKDPDVFILHQRSHTKRPGETENLTSALQANPILANLLKSPRTDSQNFVNNILSMENQIMTALAANMESYIRNLSTMVKERQECDNLNDSIESNGLVIDESV